MQEPGEERHDELPDLTEVDLMTLRTSTASPLMRALERVKQENDDPSVLNVVAFQSMI